MKRDEDDADEEQTESSRRAAPHDCGFVRMLVKGDADDYVFVGLCAARHAHFKYFKYHVQSQYSTR